jgi:hypothetical protein
MSKYNKGDKVWWNVPNSNLVILCTIEEVQKEANWTETFYWLDEPVGHAVHEDELAPESFYQATADVTSEVASVEENSFDTSYSSLDEWREKNIAFINSTHSKSGLGLPDWKHLKPKVQDTDWFLLV